MTACIDKVSDVSKAWSGPLEAVGVTQSLPTAPTKT